MTVYVDADACPVTRIAERIAKDHGIPVILLCDTNHQLTSDYSTVKVIGAGADQALWGACGIDCEFCSGCDNRGGGRIESIYQPYIDGLKEIREINADYTAPFVRG